MMWRVVVLPAPWGPSSEKGVPAPTSRSMPSRTAVPPNDLRSPAAVIALVMLLLSPPRPGGRDHVQGAPSGIHPGFTAALTAGARWLARPTPPKTSPHPRPQPLPRDTDTPRPRAM